MNEKTIGSILMPTKGSESYPQIATRANAWLSEQAFSIVKMSAEQVRKMFTDMVSKPDAIYLDAIAAVQGVDVNELYRCAGYRTNNNPPTLLERADIALSNRGDLSEAAKKEVFNFIKEMKDKYGIE